MPPPTPNGVRVGGPTSWSALLLSMYFFQMGALGPYKEQMAASLDVPLTDVVFLVTIGYILGAVLLIPGALLLERLGVRRLAWPCSLLIGGGVGLMSISQSVVGIYTSVVLVTVAVCILMPMTGVVARTRINERIFIMVSTIMLVTIRLFEVLSLTLAGFLHGHRPLACLLRLHGRVCSFPSPSSPGVR